MTISLVVDLPMVLMSRARQCVNRAYPHLSSGEFFIAGSAIATREMADIDIYPAADAPFTIPEKGVLAKSKNAVTIANDPPLQFCRYKHSSLEALIASFDFAHVQAGAHVKDGSVLRAAWTEAFIAANACRTSEFIGSAYPLSSAIRLLKYHKRGELTKTSAIRAMLDIVRAVVKRGFKDYEDFKDQLDAVDLGLVPDEMAEVDRANLLELFELLHGRGRL